MKNKNKLFGIAAISLITFMMMSAIVLSAAPATPAAPAAPAVPCTYYKQPTTNRILCAVGSGPTGQLYDVDATGKPIGDPLTNREMMLSDPYKDFNEAKSGLPPASTTPKPGSAPAAPKEDNWAVYPGTGGTYKEPVLTFMDPTSKIIYKSEQFPDGSSNYYTCKNQQGSTCINDDWVQITDPAVIKKFQDNPALQNQMHSRLNFLQKLGSPIPELSFLQAKLMGQGFWQLGTDMGWWETEADSPMYDMFGLSEFMATSFGSALSGNWEDSMCRYSTDYDNLAQNGVLMPPGTTAPIVWVSGEKQKFQHPDINNPSQTIVEYAYRIELSVGASGLTIHSGESGCDDAIKFYVKINGKSLDLDLTGGADQVVLKCDKSPYSRSGSGAIVIIDSREFNNVCLDFSGTSDFTSVIQENLDGNQICNDIIYSGSEKLEDCPYCPGSGGGLGIDFTFPDLNLGGGSGEDSDGGSDVDENRPMPSSDSDSGAGSNGGNARVP
jgi:hypothetical protein